MGFGDHVDSSKTQILRSPKVQPMSQHVSRDGSDNLSAMIELGTCQQYKPGEFLAVGSQKWNEVLDKDNDHVNWADHSSSSIGRISSGNGIDNHDGKAD